MWRPDGPMHETTWWSSWQGALIIGLLILIAGLLIWLIVRSRPTPPAGTTSGDPGGDEAVAEVRMRYARGELDRDDFLRITQDLTGRTPTRDAPAASPPATTERPEVPQPPEAPTPRAT
jgi:hypothetical protein